MGAENISAEELVERAAKIVPLLRENAMEAERRGMVPDSSMVALREAGLLDMFKPRSHGGLEVSLRTSVAVQAELGRGCGSTAWVVSQLNGNALIACMASAEVRTELFARHDTYLTGALAPASAMVQPAPGGYLISGLWPFCSGCRHASWIGVGAPFETADGQADYGLFYLPATDLEIVDDWHVSGLAGTCSNSVRAAEAFVPRSRVLEFARVLDETFLPDGLDGPLYRMPLVAAMLLNAVSSCLGMAQGAIEEFTSRLPGRGIAYTTYPDRADAPMTHLQVAEATLKLDAARLFLQRGVDDLETHAARHEIVHQHGRIRGRMDAAQTAALCREAIEIIFDASGGGSLALSNPIQRFARDARALCQHAALSIRPITETYGRSLLDLPTNTPFV